MRKMKKGIDVSRWNQITDYDAVRDAGVEYAIVKVNNSGNVADARFFEHVAGFKAAGIPILGGYNYCYANTPEKAKKASDSFVKLATSQDIDMMWLDLEDACMRGLGSRILDIINIYRHTAEAAGMKFGIYTGGSFYNPCLKRYMPELSNIPFWWARYPSTKARIVSDDIPTTKNLPTNLDLDGWQFSSTCIIPGAKGYIDLNVWFENEPFRNILEEIPVEYNPFTEPTVTVTAGTMGNDANWTLWYLYRFGKLVNSAGVPDDTLINGIIDDKNVEAIKEVQALLGLEADGKVGRCTRALWKKIC